jgi:hypothetical protein
MMNPNKTSAVLLEVDERKVASVVLNRPAVNNAYDGNFIHVIHECRCCRLDEITYPVVFYPLQAHGRGNGMAAASRCGGVA